jgi:hypothetical protein
MLSEGDNVRGDGRLKRGEVGTADSERQLGGERQREGDAAAAVHKYSRGDIAEPLTQSFDLVGGLTQ